MEANKIFFKNWNNNGSRRMALEKFCKTTQNKFALIDKINRELNFIKNSFRPTYDNEV
jgi:hypothetical protein